MQEEKNINNLEKKLKIFEITVSIILLLVSVFIGIQDDFYTIITGTIASIVVLYTLFTDVEINEQNQKNIRKCDSIITLILVLTIITLIVRIITRRYGMYFEYGTLKTCWFLQFMMFLYSSDIKRIVLQTGKYSYLTLAIIMILFLSSLAIWKNELYYYEAKYYPQDNYHYEESTDEENFLIIKNIYDR